MLDCRNKPLRAGDTVVYASAKYGLTTGILKYDADDKAAYHIELAGGKMYYPPKVWRGTHDTEILNLTEYVKDNYANEDVVGDLWKR